MRAIANECERVHLDSKSIAPLLRDAADEIVTMRAIVGKVTALPVAVAEVHRLLEPLSAEDRKRVLQAVTILLS